MAIAKHEGTLSNGMTYEFRNYGARIGFPLKIKLVSILGTPLIDLIGKVEKDAEGAMSLDKEVLKKLANGLADRLGAEGIDTLETLVAHVKIDGEEKDFDEFYGGDYGLMYEVALQVIKGNYGSLLSLVGISPTHSLAEAANKVLSQG